MPTTGSHKNDKRAKEELTAQIWDELTVYTQPQEEISYPGGEVIEEDDLLNEEMVEPESADDLITQIESIGSFRRDD